MIQTVFGISNHTLAKTVTFGIENSHANYFARNIQFDNNGFASFDAYYNDKFFKSFKLSVPGKHNVLNALSCIALCTEYGIDKEDIKNGLLKFTGAHRRFEFVGELNGASIYDDYGHHPTEIIATANAMKNKSYNKSWVVFQPHTYSRTKNLLNDFAKALTDFDYIIVTDIYAAREKNTYDISSQDLVNAINNISKKAIYIKDFEDICIYLLEHANPKDLILTLGAGTVNKIGPMLLEFGK